MENRDYRAAREAWIRLLRQERTEDELWAWQAQSWTDFCVLALTLSLHAMEGSELVVQSPLVWLDEPRAGGASCMIGRSRCSGCGVNG